MKKLGFSKKVCLTVLMFVLLLCTCLGAYFAAGFNSGITASAATTVGDRVTPLELMSVHQVDWVLGPLDVNANGSYKAANKDYNGDPTNNVYKIPADKYFNVNNYLYTTTIDDRKILRGWINNIQKVTGDSNIYINENGYVVNSGVASTNIGIYVDKDIEPSKNKYMLIMPDDITEVGTGSGAFDGATSTSGSASGTASGNSYDKFTDFAFYVWPGEAKYKTFTTAHTNYWSPRERLAGVYFNSTSQLKSVNKGANPGGGYRLNLSGKAAFAGCNNLKFFILPDNTAFTSIGEYALCNCEQLRDFTIPANVTTISSYALANCTSIVHLTVPQNATAGANAFSGMTKLSEVQSYATGITAASFSSSSLLNFYKTVNGSQLYVVGNDENDTGANGYYFCKNVLGYNGDLATVAVGTAQKYKKDNWYVVGLSGKEDSTGNLVHRFPKQVVANDPRRSNILFDYLDSAGKKCKNSVDEPITKYDIGKNMALETWCTAAVLPDCVEIVGDSAFEFSHVQYLELSATTVGTRAFYRNVESTLTNEYYYIHKQITNYGNNAFAKNVTSSMIRHYIFENKALYTTYASGEMSLKSRTAFTTTATIGSGSSAVTPDLLNSRAYYQIPVIANVVSADGDVNIIEGDMDTRFDYDVDYNTRKTVTNVDANGNGTYQITYTKRRNGLTFSAQKQVLGNWDDVSQSDHSNPTIEGMDSTQWYKSTTYTETNKTTAAGVAGTGNLSVESIKIYTKKIAKPTIVDKVGDKAYTYGDANIPSKNIDLLDLGLANPDYEIDYRATITGFTFTSGNSASTPTSVENAGTYTVKVTLNAEKWGEWTDEYQSSFIGTVVVNRKLIDLGDLANIPTFSADGVELGGEGAGEALYRYADGWYLYPQSGSQIGDTVYANNAYTRYTASEIALEYQEWKLYNISNGSGDHYAKDSRDYYATFNFSVPNIDGAGNETNFEFVYDSESANAALFELYGLVLDNKTTTSATLRKAWYIVMQSNWFIDSTETLDKSNPYSTPPYALALKNNNSVRTWTYEDVLDIRMPKLAYNQDYSTGSAVTVSPSFSIVYNGVSIVTDESDLTKLVYYVNPSMPAGTYTVIVSASAIQAQDGENYPAISDSIQIIVTPKVLNTTDLQAALQNDGNAYEFPYDMNKHLYYKEGDDSGVDYELSEINKTLNAKRAAATDEDSYWATQAANSYFGEAQITYNLDRMGTSNYSSYDLAALTSVDKYNVYYCISAKNYVTVGGENDANRRDKKFITLIYNEILVSSLFGSQNDSSEYLQDMEYNGSERYTSVPYNQLYRSEYTDEDYINARKDASVTITLLNSQTSRWKYDLTDDEQMKRVPRPEQGADVSVIKAFYDILPAKNDWAVSPQMPSWSFNGFDSTVNVVASGLKFVGADVMYRLGITDKEDETGRILWTNYFVVNAMGVVAYGVKLKDDGSTTEISQEDIISELNLLKPGNYYLQSKVGDIKVGNSVNVKGGEFVALDNGGKMLPTVNIAKATNRWTRSPNIVRWTWHGYNSGRNVISSTALYPSLLSQFFADKDIDTPVAEYQIKSIKNNGSYEDIVGLSIKDGKEFWFTADDDIAEILAGLPAGDYVLLARLNGNEYYSDIEAQESIFDIAKATNNWKTSPALTSWQYDGFTSDANFMAGEPVLTAENVSVVYTVVKPDNTEFTLTFNENGTLDSETVAALKGLDKGRYTLKAKYAESDNISDLDYTTWFDVTRTQNTWTTAPVITSWQYSRFDESTNFVAGIPVYSNAGQVVYKVGTTELEYDYNSTNNAITLKQSAIDALNALAQGNYNLTVTLAGDEVKDNYAPINNLNLQFTVMKATINQWKTLPAISGWTYGGYVSTLFTKGEADFGTVYYTVQSVGQDGNVGDAVANYAELSFDGLQGKLAGLDAGSYNLYIVSKGADTTEANNYVEATHNIRFTVAKTVNEWDTYPAIENWTYGDEPNSYTQGVAKQTTKSITYEYYPAILVNGEWRANLQEQPITISKTTAAGMYALVVTATAESNNYEVLKQTVIFQIYTAANSWKEGMEPEGTFTWVWGKVDSVVTSNSGFVKAEAHLMPVPFLVTYVIKGANNYSATIEKTANDETNLQAIINKLKTLGVGNYEITVSVAATGNYSEVSRVTYVTVTAAQFEWDNEPANASWTWGTENGENAFTQPTVKTVSDTGVTIKYEVGVKSEAPRATYTSYTELVNDYLKGKDAEIYSVKVTVSCANYTNLTKTVDVEIKQATNTWTANAPEATVSKVYNDKTFALSAAASKYGNVVYSYVNGTSPVSTSDISVVNTWINSLNASTDAYELKVYVAKDINGNYPELSVTTNIYVTGEISEWDNKDDLKDSYTFKFGEDLEADLETVVIPTHELKPSTDIEFGGNSLTYTVRYNGTVVAQPETNVDVTDYLVKNAKAGTFTITAVYYPGTENWTTLTYPITVEVILDDAKWIVEPNTEYINTYGAVEMPTPTANYPVTITVVDSERNSYELPAGEDLNKYLNTLNVGTYTVTSEIVESDNYTRPAAIETRVVINPAPNEWTSALQNVFEYKRLETFDITIPTASRGTVRGIIGSQEFTSSEDLNDYLNSNKDKYLAGNHTLKFVVDKGAHNNYNGLEYDSIIRITLNSNTWEMGEEPQATYTWTGDHKTEVFKIPEATVNNDLLRFDIVKAGSSSTAQYGLNRTQFDAALAELANGTFTITMHVGGTRFHDEETNREAIETYNKNYEVLSGTSEITITPYTNGWTKEFAGTSWIWNVENIPLTAPVAKYGNDKIIYSVSGTKSGGPFNADDTKTAFEKLLEFFKTRTAGTYTVTANVAGTDIYEGTQATTALVVINVVPNEWKKKGESKTVTYGTAITIEYEPEYNKNEMAIKVNNKTVEDLNEHFKSCGVGTYTITVSVPADKNNEYGALEDTITVTINRALNGWVDNKGFDIDHKVSDDENAAKGWQWNDYDKYPGDALWAAIKLEIPVPQNGDSVIITVKQGTTEQFTATLNYPDGEINENDVTILKSKLFALNAGDYTITAEIPEITNYLAFKQTAVEFTITKGENSWVRVNESNNGYPDISGWDYSGTTAYPDSNPKFGNKNDVVYSYSPAKFDANNQIIDLNNPNNKATLDSINGSTVENGGWSNALPWNAGTYYIRGILESTDNNYNTIVGYGSFSINAGENAWVDMPGVITWTWNNYDKDVNQFSASARSGGTITFTITKANGTKLTWNDFYTLTNASSTVYEAYANLLDGGFGFERDENDKSTKIIDSNVIAALNALKPGNYRLNATAGVTTNFAELPGNYSFTVGKADNEWTTAPNVLSFDYNGFITEGDRVSFTAGVSKYGTEKISYLVRDNNNNVVVIEGITTASTTSITAAQVAALLPQLSAGNYALEAWVTAETTATYGSLSKVTVLFSVARIENGWKETAKPQSDVSATYTALHAKNEQGNYTFGYETWFIAPETIYDDELIYSLLDTKYNNATTTTSYSYEALFEGIRSLDVGNYIIRISAEDLGNYLELSADVSLTISRLANSFNDLPANITGQWQQTTDAEGKLVNNSTLDAFTFTADYGNDTITYTIGNVTSDTLDKFEEEVAKLDAGSYQVVIAVAETNDYEGLSRTVQLDIKQGKNTLNWHITSDWVWHDGEAHFTAEKPLYGNQITVEINSDKMTSASSITVDFSSTNNPLAIINQVICGAMTDDGITGGLDAGTYTIKVTASATDNWAEESSELVTFTIVATSNRWTENGAPKLNGTLNAETEVYGYKYGATVTPSADSLHGTVKYVYYVKDESDNYTEFEDGIPENVGEYYVEVSVDATGNYEGIEETKLYFKIDKVLNESFIVSPAAVGWTWGDYNREVHMFTGIPRSGGDVSFSILDANRKVVTINDIALDRIELVAADGIHYNDVDKDLFVPDKLIDGTNESFASLIGKLTEGDYFLQINVAATDNNLAFTQVAPFKVTVARNEWTVTPKIASWSLGMWDEDANSPKAESRYGTPVIIVTSQNNNEVYFDSSKNINRLANALAGWYTMTVTVAELKGCYTGLKDTADVQVYVRGTGDKTKNSWYETPNIVSWEAIVGGVGSEPVGTPLRGLAYFEFYYAKRDENNRLVIDLERPIVAGEDSYLVEKGDNKYFKDFYMPMAPGDYFMVACAANVDSDGKIIEEDNMRDPAARHFRIENRANSFIDDPHIDTLLFLGERDSWAKPTASAALEDSEIWFTYENRETGEDLGKSMPTAEGKYRVIAHVVATYSKEETKFAEFTVELSTNEWIELPTIEGWSAEFEGNDPESLPKFGAGNVTYSYENLETGEITYKKPKYEGTYKLTATVEVYGYKDLVATTTFTVEPAFNTDLLIIDIVLGLVGCAAAIFVIYVAIRRYREN